MQILIAQAILQPSVDFTLDTATNTVTFLNAVWDDQIISIDYWTENTTETVTGNDYCSTLQVVRYSGIGVEVFLENLGTGDGSTDSYDTENGNIITGSYTLKFGVSGSNSFSTLLEDSDYTLDKDSGSVYLTSSGVSKIDGKVLYISYTHSPKMSNTVLMTFCESSAREVEKITGNYWGEVKSTTEYFDGYTSGYPQTDRPFGHTIEKLPEFELQNKSVQSITSVSFLDSTGTVDSTVDSDYVQFEESGRVILASGVLVPNGKKNVKIIYTHGYTSVPSLVAELCALICGKSALVNISGGSYDDLTSYTLGRKAFTVGEAYVNIREVISQIDKRIDQIMLDLGGNFGCA